MVGEVEGEEFGKGEQNELVVFNQHFNLKICSFNVFFLHGTVPFLWSLLHIFFEYNHILVCTCPIIFHSVLNRPTFAVLFPPFLFLFF